MAGNCHRLTAICRGNRRRFGQCAGFVHIVGKTAMDDLMKIDSATVKKLRETRSWSQEHLAEVAGVSLRTIQRVESEGSASLETRMAIASAFNMAPADLMLGGPEPQKLLLGARIGFICGVIGLTLGVVLGVWGVALGPNSSAEAGIAYSVIGLAAGLTCAYFGFMWNRYSSSSG